MHGRLRFGLLTLALSALFFGVVRRLETLEWDYSPALLELLVPVLAIMMSAFGIAWRRKLAAAGLTLLGFLSLDWLAWMTGVQALAAQPVDFAGSPLGATLGLLYGGLVIAYPIAALMIFVGRQPSRLWELPRRT